MNKEAAVQEVADKIQEMQKLFEQVVDLAQLYDLRISHTFRAGEFQTEGHNAFKSGVEWNSSSSYC